MVDLNLVGFVGFFAGLMAGTLLLPWSKQPGLKQRLDALGVSGLVGFIGAILAYVFGQAARLDLFLGGARFFSSGVAAAVAALILAWVQRFRQARRVADERIAEAKKAELRYAETRSKLDELAREAEPTRTRIFISYRREGDAAQAGRIADRLKNEFGPDQVFMDVDAIQLGVDFVKVINEEVAKCDVLLAVVDVTGSMRVMRQASDFLMPRWTSCASKSQRHSNVKSLSFPSWSMAQRFHRRIDCPRN
jgi:hypothetical protein